MKWNVLLKLRNSIRKTKKQSEKQSTLKTQFTPKEKTLDETSSYLSLDYATSTVEGNIQTILNTHITQLKREYRKWKSSQVNLKGMDAPIPSDTDKSIFLSCSTVNSTSSLPSTFEKNDVDMVFAHTFRPTNKDPKEDEVMSTKKVLGSRRRHALFADNDEVSDQVDHLKALMDQDPSKLFLLVQEKGTGKTKYALDSLLGGDDSKSYTLYFDFGIDMKEFEDKHKSGCGNFFVGNKFVTSPKGGSKPIFGKQEHLACPIASNIVQETFYESLIQKFGSAAKQPSRNSKFELPAYMQPGEHCKNFYMVRRSMLLLVYVHMLDLLAYLGMKKDRQQQLETLSSNSSTPTTPDSTSRRSTRQKKLEDVISVDELRDQGDSSPRDYFLFRRYQNNSLLKLYNQVSNCINTKFTSQQFSQFIVDHLISNSTKSENVKIDLVFDQVHELLDHTKFLYIYKSRFDHDGCQTQALPMSANHAQGFVSHIFGNNAGTSSAMVSGSSGSSSYQSLLEPVMDAIQYFSKHAENGVSRLVLGSPYVETGLTTKVETNTAPTRSTRASKIVPRTIAKETISLIQNIPLREYELKIVPTIDDYCSSVDNIRRVINFYFPIVNFTEEMAKDLSTLVENDHVNSHHLFDCFIGLLLEQRFIAVNSKKQFENEQEWFEGMQRKFLHFYFSEIFPQYQEVEDVKKRKRKVVVEETIDFEHMELPSEEEWSFSEEEEEKKTKKKPKKESKKEKKETKKETKSPKKETKSPKKEIKSPKKETPKKKRITPLLINTIVPPSIPEVAAPSTSNVVNVVLAEEVQPSTPVKDNSETIQNPQKSPGRGGKRRSTPRRIVKEKFLKDEGEEE